MANNVFQIKRKKEESSLILERYQKLTDALNLGLPSAIVQLSSSEWFENWFESAMESLDEIDREQIWEDHTVVQCALTGSPILSRLLSSICWNNLIPPLRNVILADCYNGTEHLHFPMPMFIFKLGKSLSLTSKLHIFDGTFEPEAIIAQASANKGSTNIAYVSFVPGAEKGNDELDIELVGELVKQFRKEALSFQRGWAVNETESAISYSFMYPTSMNTIQEWVLSFNYDAFGIIPEIEV